jgi:hypothetical protein
MAVQFVLRVLALLGRIEMDLQSAVPPRRQAVRDAAARLRRLTGAFAVECFVVYVAVRRRLWQSAPRPISL